MDSEGREETSKDVERYYEFLNADEINYLEFIFSKLKKNKNDTVSIQNMKKFLLASHNKDICDDLLDVFHKQGNSISRRDFLDALNCDMSKLKTKNKIKTLFDILDINNNGFITYKNFVQSAKEFDNEFDEDILKNIFQIIDLHNSDKILFDEFKSAILNI